MLRKGILSLEVDDFPDGFSLTLLTLSDSSECYSSKGFVITISDNKYNSAQAQQKYTITLLILRTDICERPPRV